MASRLEVGLESHLVAAARVRKSKVCLLGVAGVLLGGLLAAGFFSLNVSSVTYVCNEEQKELGCSICKSWQDCTECVETHERRETLDDDGETPLWTCFFICTTDQKLSGCTECADETRCTKCSEGLTAIGDSCGYQCSQEQFDSGCKECFDQNTCTACKDGYELQGSGTCVVGCTEDQASKRCTVCNSSTQCWRCQKGYTIRDGRCVADCLAKGATDIDPRPFLNDPKIRNGYKYPPMCIDEETAVVFGLGDWGGAYKNNKWTYGRGAAGDNTHHKAYKYNDNGLDRTAQLDVAKQFARRARQRKPYFVINVGDSFYWGGFEEEGCSQGAHDIKPAFDSRRWKDVFENMYDLPHPKRKSEQIPWLGVLGNHDFGGLHMDSGWDHLIYYTYNPNNKRWRIPGLYWSQFVQYRHFGIELFFMDGNHLNARPIGVDTSHNICQNKQPPANGVCHPSGMPKLEHASSQCEKWFRDLYRQQLTWLADGLKTSVADYTAIVVHYPSNCIDPHIANLIQTYGVDLCIVGHTHWQVMGQGEPIWRPKDGSHCTPKTPCDAPLTIVTGGGGGISAEIQATKYGLQYGFTDLEFTMDTMTAKFVNQEGKEFFEGWSLKRRLKQARKDQNLPM